jgi:DNA-binding response OmpR family regulator
MVLSLIGGTGGHVSFVAAAPETVMLADFSESHILLVEDDRIMRTILASRLEPLGAKVSTVANAEEAMGFLARERPSLVLSDAVMPGMDGFELCRWVRANARYRAIPFAMLTSLVQDIQARSLDAGADDFISKNADDAAFRIRVRMLLRLAPESGNSAAILAVSGSSTVRSLLQAHLPPSGITVKTASSLAEARQVLDGGVADALVVDMDLGEDSAEDLIKGIHETPWYVCLPIMLLIAKGQEPMLEALEDRIQDFLLKPLTAREDRHRVKLLLRYAQSVFAR